ncbi:MAG: hypothetical protein AMXMBFR4_25070 [Candidatus Hydrogenedentota bacterium]
MPLTFLGGENCNLLCMLKRRRGDEVDFLLSYVACDGPNLLFGWSWVLLRFVGKDPKPEEVERYTRCREQGNEYAPVDARTSRPESACVERGVHLARHRKEGSEIATYPIP